jgi:hypothetical protein
MRIGYPPPFNVRMALLLCQLDAQASSAREALRELDLFPLTLYMEDQLSVPALEIVAKACIPARSPGHPTCLSGPRSQINTFTSSACDNLYRRYDLRHFHTGLCARARLKTLLLACSLLAGYDTAARKPRSWIHLPGFAVIVAGSILLTVDYEYPAPA